jgi:hypothetical protein
MTRKQLRIAFVHPDLGIGTQATFNHEGRSTESD